MAKIIKVSDFKVNNLGEVISHEVKLVYYDKMLIAKIVDGVIK